MQAVAPPALAFVRDPALVQVGRDLLEPDAAPGFVEDLLHDRSGLRIDLQSWSLLGPVLDLDSAVSERCLGTEKEASRSRLAHAPSDLLGQVLRVELIDALDDRLHQLAGRRVVGVLRNRSDPNAATAQHRLESDGVLALAGEARELPDQNLLEWGVRQSRFVQHLAELRPVGHASRLCFVDVLADHDEAVALSEIAQGAKLGSDGKVDILSVAGDAGIECRWCQLCLVFHFASLSRQLSLASALGQTERTGPTVRFFYVRNMLVDLADATGADPTIQPSHTVHAQVDAMALRAPFFYRC